MRLMRKDLSLVNTLPSLPTVSSLSLLTPLLTLSPCHHCSQHSAHAALTVSDLGHEQVQQFHAAALKAGATSNGAPGLRNHYHRGYYGAFVIHPDCNVNLEVVCHGVTET